MPSEQTIISPGHGLCEVPSYFQKPDKFKWRRRTGLDDQKLKLKSASPIPLFCYYHLVLVSLSSTASCLIPIEGLSMLFEQSCYWMDGLTVHQAHQRKPLNCERVHLQGKASDPVPEDCDSKALRIDFWIFPLPRFEVTSIVLWVAISPLSINSRTIVFASLLEAASRRPSWPWTCTFTFTSFSDNSLATSI